MARASPLVMRKTALLEDWFSGLVTKARLTAEPATRGARVNQNTPPKIGIAARITTTYRGFFMQADSVRPNTRGEWRRGKDAGMRTETLDRRPLQRAGSAC